jgi:hypothetical protein
MEVKTYTTFWNQEKKLYSINDIALPFAIPLRTLFIFILIAIPWLYLLLGILHVPFSSGFSIILFFGPPAGLAYMGGKPILEQKSLVAFLRSQANFWMTEARHWKGFVPNRDGEKQLYHTSYRVYRRDRKR